MMKRVKYTELVEGMTLVADNGFDCLAPGEHTVHFNKTTNDFYITCKEGSHYLSGQKGAQEYLVGLYEPVDPLKAKIFKNFKNMDRVILHSTNSEFLDGYTGTIVGISYKSSQESYYIVELDAYPIPTWPWKCVTLTEHCIDYLKKGK